MARKRKSAAKQQAAQDSLPERVGREAFGSFMGYLGDLQAENRRKNPELYGSPMFPRRGPFGERID